MKNKLLIIFFILLNFLFADGLLMPVEENYPKDFLKNRITRINVKIHGIIAETTVYQEFVNEWHDSTDAVYSFPLPDNAKATKFLYWYKNEVYEAILKVREQAGNPGTGEGGVVAYVNEYIGRNGIRIALMGIQPGKIQKTELHYINKLDYYKGKCTYNFPLNTKDFIQFPIDNLEFNVQIESNSPIIEYGIPSYPDFQVRKSTDNELNLNMVKPKSYLNKDLEFYYQVDHSEMGVDFYSTNNDSTDGHFGLIIRPEVEADAEDVHPRRIFFLLSNSSVMVGNKIEQCKLSISQMLDKLTENDQFNIVTYNYYINNWESSPQQATASSILNAKNWLNNISISSGSNMTEGLKRCLNQTTNDNYNNSILVFSGGYSLTDPKDIAENNSHNTGIFPIGIGDDLSYAQLEMTANKNYGFVTYIGENDNIKEKTNKVFDLISQPILKSVTTEFGGISLSSVTPEKIPASYAGSYFFTTGRYATSGEFPLSIGGKTVDGFTAFDFILDFTAKNSANKFIEILWAKEMIDALEWEIEIYGETGNLKQQMIDLSLKYNIRCRYTAYVADYENVFTKIDDEVIVRVPESFIAGNYPNPFNPTTNLRIFINPNNNSKIKMVKIYDILGRLVAIIDISHLSSGWNTLVFDGHDQYGNMLPSGVYIVTLQMQNQIMNTIRINLVK